MLPPPPIEEGGYVESTTSPVDEVAAALDLQEQIRKIEEMREGAVHMLARMGASDERMASALRAHDATDFGVFGSWFSVLMDSGDDDEDDQLGNYSFAPWILMLRTTSDHERQEVEALVSESGKLLTPELVTEKLSQLTDLIDKNVDNFVALWSKVTCDAIFKTDVEKVVIQVLNDLTQTLYLLMHARPATFYGTAHGDQARGIFSSLAGVMARVYSKCVECDAAARK